MRGDQHLHDPPPVLKHLEQNPRSNYRQGETTPRGSLRPSNDAKALIVFAAQEDGPGIGRIRMRPIPNASAESLIQHYQEASVCWRNPTAGINKPQRSMLPPE
jgi:hypothetical protein